MCSFLQSEFSIPFCGSACRLLPLNTLSLTTKVVSKQSVPPTSSILGWTHWHKQTHPAFPGNVLIRNCWITNWRTKIHLKLRQMKASWLSGTLDSFLFSSLPTPQYLLELEEPREACPPSNSAASFLLFNPGAPSIASFTQYFWSKTEWRSDLEAPPQCCQSLVCVTERIPLSTSLWNNCG